MGTKVGRGVACMGGVVAEYEQVSIGEGTVVNEGTFILTHTVENRCAKIRPISIGTRVTIGGLCAVLPDAAMEDGSSLADMSLVRCGRRGRRQAGATARGWAGWLSQGTVPRLCSTSRTCRGECMHQAMPAIRRAAPADTPRLVLLMSRRAASCCAVLRCCCRS